MTICIIPARFQSTRFPGKLLKIAGGLSVLQRTYTAAKSAKNIDEVFNATDDARIADHATSFGGKILWTSTSCKNGSDRVAEAVMLYPELQKAHVILNLQGDHPLTRPNTIEQVVGLLRKDPLADVATAAKILDNDTEKLSPHVVKCVLDQQGRALYFSRAGIPHGNAPCYQHIGIYAYKTSFLLKLSSLPDTPLQIAEDLEQLKFLELGFRIAVSIVEELALGVDTPNDLITLEKYLCQSNTFS